jgi:hypothetical protein
MKTKGELAKGGEPFRKSERHGFDKIETAKKAQKTAHVGKKESQHHPSEKSRGDLNTKPNTKKLSDLGITKKVYSTRINH